MYLLQKLINNEWVNIAKYNRLNVVTRWFIKASVSEADTKFRIFNDSRRVPRVIVIHNSGVNNRNTIKKVRGLPQQIIKYGGVKKRK